MEKLKQIRKIKEVYEAGGNIIQYLKGSVGSSGNSTEDIQISYDLQAGSYTVHLARNREFKLNYCGALARVLETLGPISSIMEAGVGEATTLSVLLKSMKHAPGHAMGFDISWSRLKFARDLLKDFDLPGVELFVADLFRIPLRDGSVDVVYTSHSIEPNGGREEEALLELHRIAGRYLVLLEPGYEFASAEARKRMDQHGYVKDLRGTAERCGFKVVVHEPFAYSANPLNPTQLLIIEKTSGPRNAPELICPATHTALVEHGEGLRFPGRVFLPIRSLRVSLASCRTMPSSPLTCSPIVPGSWLPMA